MNKRAAQHPGRKRRVVGWVLCLPAVVLALFWGSSKWSAVEWYFGRTRLLVVHGTLLVNQLTAAAPSLKSHVQTEYGRDAGWEWWEWGCKSYTNDPWLRSFDASFPLWILSAGLTVLSVPLLRSGIIAHRRARAGCCLACGYDMRGLAAGAVCPECGK